MMHVYLQSVGKHHCKLVELVYLAIQGMVLLGFLTRVKHPSMSFYTS